MKEEDGMNRRRSSKWLVGATMSTAAALVASSALAANPYTNLQGVMGGNTVAPAQGVRRAGATLNPGGIGQVLLANYYDVRDYDEAAGGITSAQENNIVIINTTPKLSNTPGQSGNWGGVLARVRFRESRESREVLDFDIALSCAEVWTAHLFLNKTLPNPVPALETAYQIVDVNTVGALSLTNKPLSDFAGVGAVEFPSAGSGRYILNFTPPSPTASSALDTQRGYFEVIGMEALPCEPVNPQTQAPVAYNPTGQNTYLRGQAVGAGAEGRFVTAPNSLAGEVFVIRPTTGTSYNYVMSAISRFNVVGDFSIYGTPGGGTPTLEDCRGPNNANAVVDPSNATDAGFYDNASQPGPVTDAGRCINQIDFQLSKNRLILPYDLDPNTAARTHLVVTQPTKHHHCLGTQPSEFPPFSCAAAGEIFNYVAYNRVEKNLCVSGQSSISPAPGSTPCSQVLPREVTIVQVGQGASSASVVLSDRADVPIPVGAEIDGWIDIDLADIEPNNTFGHARTGLDNNLVDLLGAGFSAFRGLPVLTLILQDYVNLNAVSGQGGFFGNSVPAPYEVFHS
jgi:hypothetical protein